MSKLINTDEVILCQDYDRNAITVDCYCERRKIYVVRHLLSELECENIISWMNLETRHEELGRDSRYI